MTGDWIGAIGMRGRSLGPHLHLETYPAGILPGEIYRATDPTMWLERRGAAIAVDTKWTGSHLISVSVQLPSVLLTNQMPRTAAEIR
jgi:hypothetical protein